jgi:hypothetical protein
MISALSVAFTAAPASARGIGCDATTVSKVGDGIDAMADGPGKDAANVEVTAVNTAMSNGDARGCAVHLRKAIRLEAMKPASSM